MKQTFLIFSGSKPPPIPHICFDLFQTSPLKYTRDGTLPTKFLAIKDSTKTVKIALFGEDAQNDYNPNDVMAITDVYRWKASETLSTKQTSKVEVCTCHTVHTTNNFFFKCYVPEGTSGGILKSHHLSVHQSVRYKSFLSDNS